MGIQNAKSILFSPEKKDFYLNDLNKKIKDLKDEKEFILIKNGYSKDYFEPFYECKLAMILGLLLMKILRFYVFLFKAETFKYFF